MTLRIALFGAAAFGRDCLDRVLQNGHDVVGVFAPPSSARPEALATRAEELGIPVVRRRYYQTRDGQPIAAALESYQKLRVDLNVLASFTSFLPAAIVNAPPKRSICFHPSLLPRFRGGAALQWQIILGERETGVTVFMPDEGVDTGPIVTQRGGVRIDDSDTTGSLFFEKLSPLGVQAIVEAVTRIDAGSIRPIPQDEACATFQGLIRDADSAIDLERPSQEIDRLVRGCDPQPGAFVRWNNQPLRLFDTHFESEIEGKPGDVVVLAEDGLQLALRRGGLRVRRVRSDRGKEKALDFAERAGLRPGDSVMSG